MQNSSVFFSFINFVSNKLQCKTPQFFFSFINFVSNKLAHLTINSTFDYKFLTNGIINKLTLL